MGIENASDVPIDMLAEYRMIFQESFRTYVAAKAKDGFCKNKEYELNLDQDILDRAASAFYPGWMEWSARSQFKNEMQSSASVARMSGISSALGDGCTMSAALADLSIVPVEAAITGAIESR